MVALVSLFTALIELSEALKQHSKHNKSLPLRHWPLDQATALPSSPELGLPPTLFYPRASGLPNGFSVKEARHARKTTTPQVPPWESPLRRRRACRRCSPCPPRPPKTPARYSKTRFPLEAMSILGHSFHLKPIRKARPIPRLDSGTQFPLELPDGKARPTLKLDSGIQLPPETSTGNGIPLWSQNPGRSFRLKGDPESASQSERSFRDAISA